MTHTTCECYLPLGPGNVFSSLSIEQLRRIISLKEQIAALEGRLSPVIGVPAPATPTAKRSGSGKRSAATRARMEATQKARRARSNAEAASPSAKMFRRR